MGLRGTGTDGDSQERRWLEAVTLPGQAVYGVVSRAPSGTASQKREPHGGHSQLRPPHSFCLLVHVPFGAPMPSARSTHVLSPRAVWTEVTTEPEGPRNGPAQSPGRRHAGQEALPCMQLPLKAALGCQSQGGWGLQIPMQDGRVPRDQRG